MNLQFLTADDAAWGKFLAVVQHDFYHLPSYAQLMAPFDGGQPEAVLIRDRDQYFFLPYIVRPLAHIDWLGDADAKLFDIVSPYGYPGPLMSTETSCLARLLGQWHQAMRARGCVSGFIRLHPLLDTTNDVLGTCGELIERGRTVSIDLRCSLEQLWQQTRENHRRDIVKRRQSGMTVSIEDEPGSLEIFAEIYRETMGRVGAAGYYYFPFDYFQGLRETLGDKFSLAVVRSAQGAPLAGGIFTECCGIVQYHLGGTLNSALQDRPSKLMFDWVRSWAKQRGNTVFHLGGGFGAKEDSVFDFKAGFSPLRHPYFTWQVLFEPTAYRQLEDKRRSLSDAEPDAEFFPIYRA